MQVNAFTSTRFGLETTQNDFTPNTYGRGNIVVLEQVLQKMFPDDRVKISFKIGEEPKDYKGGVPKTPVQITLKAPELKNSFVFKTTIHALEYDQSYLWPGATAAPVDDIPFFKNFMEGLFRHYWGRPKTES